VLDISNTVVSVGKIRMAALRNEKIPLGWATDSDGTPTQDPLAALKGLLTPIGDYKGYGITLIMDVLCGVLTGSGFADIVQPIESDCQQIGHILGAINIEAFMPIENYYKRMKDLVYKMKGSKKQEGVTEILVPGELEYQVSEKRMKKGIPLPVPLFEELISIAKNFGRPLLEQKRHIKGNE
jgi:LDH2 family malate/lactate/ureidoglycolate dehydrogenase